MQHHPFWTLTFRYHLKLLQGVFGAWSRLPIPAFISILLALTHVTGCLATGGEGTALGVIACAYKQRPFAVYADETRPLLQGSRLTAWELKELGIPVRVLCDSAAGALMESGRIGAVIVGADRITSNGDVANKIGTYSLAILAKFHNVPFFVAAPFSSFDLTIASGKEIVIEQRQSTEVTRPMDVQVTLSAACSLYFMLFDATSQAAPIGVDAFNPAFDVTPAYLVHSIITERGVVHPVTGTSKSTRDVLCCKCLWPMLQFSL